MIIKIFGRSGCARTRKVFLQIDSWVKSASLSGIVVKVYDLETAEGLAEAAYQQLDGELPVVLVEAEIPGREISGEPPFQDRKNAPEERGGSAFWIAPSLN